MFHERSHSYFYGDIKIPSVSDLVNFALGSGYEDVPQYILDQAAEHGTRVHEAIEDYLTKGETESLPLIAELSLEEFKKLEKKHGLEVISIEEIVHYQGRYAGRFDLLALMDGIMILLDNKTTAQMDEERVRWQLSYYRMAWQELNKDQKIEKIGCIWLPKEKEGILIQLKPITKKELLDNLKRYEREKKQTIERLPF